MKGKILDILYQKISTEFKIAYPPFLRKGEYESQLNDVKDHVKKHILAGKLEYERIVNSNDLEVYRSLIKVAKREFIENNLKYFKYVDAKTQSEKEMLYELIINTRFDDSKIESLINSNWNFNDYCNGRHHFIDIWVISLEKYLVEIKDTIINSSSNTSLCTKIISAILPKSNYYFDFVNLNLFLKSEEIPDEIIQYIRRSYLQAQGAYMDLLESAEKYIQRENLLPFSSWVLNVGSRDFYNSYNRTISKYKVSNEGREYSFEHKNDGKGIKDVFVNLFILSNNELLKLSIGSSNLLQRTPYLISKDIQRVDITVGNVLEIHMHKHFDPETIIFDNEDEAYNFQLKITELRDSRKNPNTRK